MYKDKGIQMLDKPQLIFSDIQDPQLKFNTDSTYKTMKNELSKKGYIDFKFLGEGAQGLVLLAKKQDSNKRFAIKGVQVRNSEGKINQESMEQVKQEIDMLKKCKGSPYVVSLLGEIEGEQFIYLILSECQGTLMQIFEQNNKRLNELSAIKYAKDIAEGLYFIHSKECLVNDLKMDNILIDFNGNAVISDFGFADKLTQKSGYSMHEYKGNVLYQAPECYDPEDISIYSEEYQKLGITVKKEPSNRSEACSLGYIIYTMIQGINLKLISSKHQPLSYNSEFNNFEYKRELQYVIDGLTKFIPRERLPIKTVLVILKGIISLEFKLDEIFVEMIDGAAAQERFLNEFKNDVEFVEYFSDKLYPIIKNEQKFIEDINLKITEHQKDQEGLISQLENTIFQLKQEIITQEEIVKNAQTDLQKLNLQGTLIAQLEQQIFQLKQEIQEFQKTEINQQNKQPAKLKEITIEEEHFLQHQKQVEIEIIQKQDNQFENKRHRQKGKCTEYNNSYKGHLIYSIGFLIDKKIGYIKDEDFENRTNLKKISLYDCSSSKQIGYVYNNIGKETKHIKNAQDYASKTAYAAVMTKISSTPPSEMRKNTNVSNAVSNTASVVVTLVVAMALTVAGIVVVAGRNLTTKFTNTKNANMSSFERTQLRERDH